MKQEKGRKTSDETKKKLRIARLGKHLSVETKEKLRGKKRSEETKQKMRIINTGLKRSEETKQKMSISAKKSWLKRNKEAC